MAKIKYITRGQLVSLGQRASKPWEGKDTEIRYPVISHMLHNDSTIRCWLGDALGQTFVVDLPIGTYLILPTEEVPD